MLLESNIYFIEKGMVDIYFDKYIAGNKMIP